MYPLYAYLFKSDGQVCTRCTLICSNLMDKYVPAVCLSVQIGWTSMYPLYTYVFKSDGQVCTRCMLICSNLMDKYVPAVCLSVQI